MMNAGFEGCPVENGGIERGILYSSHTYKTPKRFALTVLLLKENIELETISRIVGVNKRQVYNYRKTYETQGATAMTTDARYRPVSELEQYREIIKDELVKNPAATASEASERISKLTGIKRSPTQVRAFMHKLGLKPLKVASIPAKADHVVQTAFFENELEPRINEAKKGVRTILFMDAAHFVWQLYIGVLWSISRIFTPAASGRVRINVLGAYDPLKNKLIKIVNRSYITSREIIKLLVKIKTAYSDQAVTIVLDNAKYQRCNAVKEKAKELNIELLFLPSYSPNLNLIERLWRFVKKECLYSKYYKTANEFEEAIINCLGKINTAKRLKMKKLMTLKFQMFPTSAFKQNYSMNTAA
jgi:transposase